MDNARIRFKRLAIAVLVAASIVAFLEAGPSSRKWKAGIARANITPIESMWMAGYAARTHPSEGKLQDLWLKVLALEDSTGQRAIVVTTDLLGLPAAVSNRVYAQLHDKFGLARRAVMFASSHTHCGPVLSGALLDIYPMDEEQQSKVDAYTARLEQQMVEAVEQALKNLAPAELAAGIGTAGFAVNRRNNTEEDVLKGKELKGPVDHSVPVLKVRGHDGRLLAIVFAYACHNTTLDFYQWCGDYAGFAQEYLERQHPGATALFVAGCGADANPIPRRSLNLCMNYGSQLAAAVDRVLAARMQRLDPLLETAFSQIDLPLAPAPARDELVARTENKLEWVRRWARRMLVPADRGDKFIDRYPYPVQVWRLGGRQVWIALGGEVVVDYALRLKRELGESVWVTAYANDVMAYIPSLRILKEGGYEGATSMMAYGMPSIWTPPVEELIVTEVKRLVQRVRNQRTRSSFEQSAFSFQQSAFSNQPSAFSNQPSAIGVEHRQVKLKGRTLQRGEAMSPLKEPLSGLLKTDY
ncbi:MAG TPA: neutral/alkaline non-lysosomal ceramidase N-terminal domain-containing protein [Acidobacteriota bacterium]|jgi:hypothetical protein